MVGPFALATHPLNDSVRKLGSKSKRMDDVGEVVRLALGEIPVVFQIVDVHVTIAKAAAGSKMEVSNNLVDLQQTLNAAALFSLLVEPLSVVLSLALLYALTPSKGP